MSDLEPYNGVSRTITRRIGTSCTSMSICYHYHKYARERYRDVRLYLHPRGMLSHATRWPMHQNPILPVHLREGIYALVSLYNALPQRIRRDTKLTIKRLREE